MRKLWLGLAIMMAALVPLSPAVAADDLLFGQQHNYSVTMRGNGESVVTARIVFSNTGETNLDKFTFTVPKLAVSDMIGYQEHIQSNCTSYGGPQPLAGSSSAAGPATQAVFPRPCLKYAPVDYTDTYGSTSTYSKLKFDTAAGNKYTITLPTPVTPGENAALLISYSGKGYASQALGAYKFDFQTLKVQQRVKNVTVALDVDSGLYLLDGKSKVSYAKNPSGTTDSLQSGASSAALDRVSSSVGAGGQMSEEGKDLAPGDTLGVKGTYADAAWKLHPWRVALLAALALALVVGGLWLWRRSRRTRAIAAPAQTEQTAAKSVAMPAPKPVAMPAPKPPATVTDVKFADPLFIALGAASVIAVGLITWFVISYGSAGGDGDQFSMLLTGILTVMAYVLAIVGPLAWAGLRRHDWRACLYTFVWQVAWLVVLLLVYQVGLKPLLPDATGGGQYDDIIQGARVN
jgi:hypothetical protein